MKAFGQAIYVRTEVQSVNQVTGVDGGFSASIPYGKEHLRSVRGCEGQNATADYLSGGAYGLSCPVEGGCTNSQAFPVSPELAALLNARGPNMYHLGDRHGAASTTRYTGDPIAQSGVDSNWSLGGTTWYMPGRELNNKTQLFQVLARFRRRSRHLRLDVGSLRLAR